MTRLPVDYYDGMTFEQAWADYHRRRPEVLASWCEQNGRFPADAIPADIIVVVAR